MSSTPKNWSLLGVKKQVFRTLLGHTQDLEKKKAPKAALKCLISLAKMLVGGTGFEPVTPAV